MHHFKYAEPQTIAEAIDILNEYGDLAKILAGGTDLITQIKTGKCLPAVVVNIAKIRELSWSIQQLGTEIRIGALTTLADVAKSDIIRKHFPALAEGADAIGSKQIRNKATLVGNICNASPAADTLPPLLIYEANVHVAGPNDRKREIPLEDFITGPRRTVLQRDEMVQSIVVPIGNINRSAYLKLSRRDGVDLAIVGTAVYADTSREIRIALGAVGPKPFRAREAEEWLKESKLDCNSINQAADKAAQQANPITDLRGSREYRLAMIKVQTRNTIEKVLSQLTDRE